jgi:uncharacterized protein (UPF0335 family)
VSRAPSADGSVAYSHNEPVNLTNEAELEKVIRVAKAEYNSAADIKREAIATMRDEKRAFQKANAASYEEITAIMDAARDRLKGKLRLSDSYRKAEDEKRDASARMKAVVKMLKEKGIDVAAFKQMLRMAEMDEIERQEYFDSIDIYCKVSRLW